MNSRELILPSYLLLLVMVMVVSSFQFSKAFVVVVQPTTSFRYHSNSHLLLSSSSSSSDSNVQEEIDYDIPEDAVITIKPKAMNRLRELKEKGRDGFINIENGCPEWWLLWLVLRDGLFDRRCN